MTDPNVQVCPVCGVRIENGEKVMFSVGKPGTRARLWARVCNYVQKEECINQDQESIGFIPANDYYRPI